MTGLFAVAPDTRFQVEDLAADGDRVALRVTVHRGAPEPGKIPQTILENFRVEHGRVAEIWGAGTPARPDKQTQQLSTGSLRNGVLTVPRD